MAEISLEEARKLYKTSEEAKSLLLTKYRKEDLENTIPSQEDFTKFVFELMSNRKVQFLDEKGNRVGYPTNRYELLDDNGIWLFDIEYGEKEHFWYSLNRIFPKLLSKTTQADMIQPLMKHLLENTMKLYQCQGKASRNRLDVILENTMKLYQCQVYTYENCNTLLKEKN